MKRLRPFVYHQPASVREAVELLAGEGGEARVLAGGTDLLVDMKLGKLRPPVVVNLKRIEGLDRIDATGEGIRIGALVPVADLESSVLLRERYPALWQASRVLATRPIRRLATIGGNLGRASPASDLAPPLIVHESLIEIEGVGGKRLVPVEELCLGPGLSCLSRDEIITTVVLPAPPAGSGSAYRKLGRRGGGWDVALVGAAAGLRLGESGLIDGARIALAAVAPTPLRVPAAEEALSDALPTEQSLAEAARIAAVQTQPITDLRADAAHRRRLAEILTRRTLHDALARALIEGRPS